jgi:hypothetical protein
MKQPLPNSLKIMIALFLWIPILIGCQGFDQQIIDSMPTSIMRSSTSDKPLPLQPTLFNVAWDNREIFRDGLAVNSQDAILGSPGASISHIDLQLSEDLMQVNGKIEILYTNQEDQPLSEIQLHMFPNILDGKMEITTPKVNGIPVEPVFGPENRFVELPFSSPLLPGERAVISMDFYVEVPDHFGSNYGIFSVTSDVLAYSHGYPMVAVYDEGWKTEVPSPYGDVTFNDAGFFLVRITAPKELVIAASGSEAERKLDNEKQVVTYALGPGRDFYFAASKDFIETSTTVDGIEVNLYAPPTRQPYIDQALDVASQSLKIYSEEFGPYPYRELDLVATPMLALGMEYPGIVAITDKIIEPDLSDDSEAAGISEYVIAHEVGHQWFYNLVGNDQLNDPWLDESLTQYATLTYASARYGQDGAQGFRSSLFDRWNEVDNADIPIGEPVAFYNPKEYSAIIYGRGGLFFEALKNRMGENEFNAFLKDYSTTFSWNISSTKKIKDLAEQHCDCSLDSLFQDWVYLK